MTELEGLAFDLMLNASNVKTMFPSYAELCSVERQLKRHIILYYELDIPEIQDWEYDLLIKHYNTLCEHWGVPNVLATMVGADLTNPCLHKTYFDLTGVWPCALPQVRRTT